MILDTFVMRGGVYGRRNGHPATYQNVWSQRYLDALILRDENTDADGLCDDGRVFYLADANYNVTAAVAESTFGQNDWAVRERYLYSPYGEATILDADFSTDADNISDHATTTLYTGRESDAETGIYYYRARYYHAQLGRFVSRDPIGFAAGDANLYRYVLNSPSTHADPSGLAVVTVAKQMKGAFTISTLPLAVTDPAQEKALGRTSWGYTVQYYPSRSHVLEPGYRLGFVSKGVLDVIP